jgi:hypothetical protein
MTTKETPREAAVRRYCDESGARYNLADFDDAGNLMTLSVDAIDRLDNAALAAQVHRICEDAYHDGPCEYGRILEEVIGRLSTVNLFDIGALVRIPPERGLGALAVVAGPATESLCVRLADGQFCDLDLAGVTRDDPDAEDDALDEREIRL